MGGAKVAREGAGRCRRAAEDRARTVTAEPVWYREGRRENVFPIERKKRGEKHGGAEESVAGAN